VNEIRQRRKFLKKGKARVQAFTQVGGPDLWLLLNNESESKVGCGDLFVIYYKIHVRAQKVVYIF